MKKNSILPMDLQFFADPAGSGDGESIQPATSASDSAVSAAANSTAAASSVEEPKYTDKQLNDIINQKFAKWKSAEEAKATEAQKLSQMDDDQKTNYELEKAQSEAAGLKEQLARFDMEKTARGLFDTANIPVTQEDVGLVVTSEAESTKSNVDQLVDFATRIRSAAEKEFLQGNPVYRGGQPLNQKAGSRGEKIAKSIAAGVARENPYFKKPKGE